MLGINLTYFYFPNGNKPCSGISLYALDTVSAMIELGYSDKIALIVHPSCVEDVSKVFPSVNLFVESRVLRRGLVPISKKFYDCVTCRLYKNSGITCIWYPYVWPETLLNTRMKKICTVHDIIPLVDNYSCTKHAEYKRMFQECENIVAISNHTKKDIESTIQNCNVNRIIYNPISLETSETKEISVLKNTTYILDLNAYSERKNGKTLARAFSIIKDYVDFDLVFCGGDDIDGYYYKLIDFVESLDLRDRVHFFKAISEEEKNWLLQNAKLLVSPSASEGFGRTPIEAAMFKIPVLTSRVDSLPEITDNLLNYYNDTYSAEELSEAILKVYNRKIDQNEMDNISKHFAHKYSPQSVAEQYIEMAEEQGAFTSID